MPKNILVVDDEPGIRHMVSFELSARGYKVHTADSGVKALEILGAEPVDLVITDMRMPVMDGLDTVITLRKTHPSLPVILMTGFIEERVQKVMEYNIHSCLQKPFTLDQMAELVTSALDGSPQK